MEKLTWIKKTYLPYLPVIKISRDIVSSWFITWHAPLIQRWLSSLAVALQEFLNSQCFSVWIFGLIFI